MAATVLQSVSKYGQGIAGARSPALVSPFGPCLHCSIPAQIRLDDAQASPSPDFFDLERCKSRRNASPIRPHGLSKGQNRFSGIVQEVAQCAGHFIRFFQRGKMAAIFDNGQTAIWNERVYLLR